ncbi:unnamed protein product [Macrosiphum euphorbiae]|uniref:Uncharacterized protein n=1 Tax=Macrosiphum euphorbiae TaxID=13131 RepID=A0AAV0W0T8_9HEMI|nr:unnamed protein product [Macrosiphum euphorbiae]
MWMCSHKIGIRPWVVQQLLTTDDDQFVFSHYLIIFVSFGFTVVVWSVNSRARQSTKGALVRRCGRWSLVPCGATPVGDGVRLDDGVNLYRRGDDNNHG